MKDLELERKMVREEHRARQRMGGNIENHMTEIGRWALGSITQNTAHGSEEMYSDVDVGRRGGGSQGLERGCHEDSSLHGGYYHIRVEIFVAVDVDVVVWLIAITALEV